MTNDPYYLHSIFGNRFETVGKHTLTPHTPVDMTVFHAPGLRLIAVPWMWAIALKLVRYEKNDPTDVAAILRMGLRRYPQHTSVWTHPQILEQTLVAHCHPMYQGYRADVMHIMRQRMADACQRASRPQIYW